MTQEFAGKVAVVTGSSGIGLGAALTLARGGAEVFLCGINPGYNQIAQRAAAGLALIVSEVDIADETSVKNWIEAITAKTDGIDILVNAAGIQSYGDIETTDTAHWDSVMNINLRGCFLVAHYVYPHMKKRGKGSIIHVASVQGHANQNNVLAYAASKGAQHALTRAMAVDCAKHNIRVNSVSPGSIRTPLLEFAAEQLVTPDKSKADLLLEFGASHPIGRIGEIAETNELIAFLASERSAFCTGGDYKVDGGLTAALGF